jgi:phage terminase large subunit
MPDPAELKAMEALLRWRKKPSSMVRELFKVEPDPWQAEALDAYPRNPRLAMKASKGVGKTACLAWIAWNFLLTRPQPKVLATSISGDNLSDGLWTEMDMWRGKSPLLQKHFEWTKTRIYHRGQYETTWWMAARQWSQSADKSQQANTLAGMHADYILFLLDESGGIPDPVMVTAEAALSSCIEGHIVQAGNPTHLSGPLYRAVNLEKHLWKVIEINGDPDDKKRSTRISLQWATDMIKTWGREHPYVMVNVLGRFPPSSFNALIGPDEVRDSMKRFYREFELGNAPRVMGVDVALFGDDQSVIAFRQGLQMYPFKKYRNLQPSQGASIVSREWEEFRAQAAFVDATGGAGAGWVDGLMLLGRAPIGVQFAGQAHESQRYANKRAEMYFDLVNWIKRGGALPPDDNLLAQLTATTYTYEKRGDRFLIEPKDLVKTKLNGNSPDEADACALCHAEAVSAAEATGRPRHQHDYNPFSEDRTSSRPAGRYSYSYDPFST